MKMYRGVDVYIHIFLTSAHTDRWYTKKNFFHIPGGGSKRANPLKPRDLFLFKHHNTCSYVHVLHNETYGACNRSQETRNTCQIFAERGQGKRPLERPNRRNDDHDRIKNNLISGNVCISNILSFRVVLKNLKLKIHLKLKSNAWFYMNDTVIERRLGVCENEVFGPKPDEVRSNSSMRVEIA
jgi:hypothetical protein